MDTVHKTSNRYSLYYDPSYMVAWSPNGLGADDRAGIYSILLLIQRGLRPNIAFTHDEETGMGGARALSLVKMEDYGITNNFLIELDRHGTEQVVYYRCGNEEFKKFIEGYGFKREVGSASDISQLAPAWNVAAVNVGIGYYSEHTKQEMLYVDEMLNAVKKVERILKWASKNPTKKFDFQEEKVVYANYNYRKNTSYTSYADDGYPMEDGDDTYYRNSPLYEWSEIAAIPRWIYKINADKTKNPLLGDKTPPKKQPQYSFFRNSKYYEWDKVKKEWCYKENADKTKNPASEVTAIVKSEPTLEEKIRAQIEAEEEVDLMKDYPRELGLSDLVSDTPSEVNEALRQMQADEEALLLREGYAYM
jgi:hypothetical protein